MPQTCKHRLHRIAVSRLHLPNGQVLLRQVLEFQDDKLLRYFPLVEEMPHTQWLGGDYFLKTEDE